MNLFRIYIKFSVIVVLLLAGSFSGCIDSHAPPVNPPGASLLLLSPRMAEINETQDQLPDSTRLIINHESIEGWQLSESGELTLPADMIQRGGRISIRLGVTGDFRATHGDLIIKVDFIEKYWQDERRDEFKETHNLYEASLMNSPELLDNWTLIDEPITLSGAKYGDVRISVEGDLSNHPDLEIFCGSPALYWPNPGAYKNVLLIGVDTLRADMLNTYGEPDNLTPVLEQFASESTTFLQNRSQSPWTLPSFASMITGGLPSRIGATMLSWSLPERATSVAEILREQGYATGTVCSNAYVGNTSSGFQQGMDSFWYEYNARAEVSIDQAKDFIDMNKDRGWFLFLHFEDPHTPFTPSQDYIDQWCDPNYEGDFETAYLDEAGWKFLDEMPPQEDVDQVRNLYRAEIAYLDHSLGELFDYLDELDLRGDTLIIFSADHGEEFYEHGAFEHGHTHYDELIKTPLIVHGRGFPEGYTFEDSVGNTDIVPTILDWLSIPLPDSLEGVPLQEVVSQQYQTDRIIFGEDNIRGTQRKYAVQWPYKCIFDYADHSYRLYNLERDPEELSDIADLYPEVVGNLIIEILLKMLPEKSTFNVWFMGSFVEEPHLFTGILRVPGGIASVQPFAFSDDDTWTLEGDTVHFSITNANPTTRVDKHFVIVPSEGTDTLEIEFLVDGEIRPDKLFPYGTNELSSSNIVSVSLSEFPLVANIPTGENAFTGAMYVWGIQGFGEDQSRAEMDPETRAILESLSYIH